MSPGERQVLWSVNNTPVFSQGGPKEPTTRAYSKQHTVDHEAPRTNLGFFHASCCARVWHYSSIEYFNRNRCIVCGHLVTTLKCMLSREHAPT